MSIKKQELIDEIDTLPDELVGEVSDFVEHVKNKHMKPEAPESVIIKSKEDLKAKIQAGLDDAAAGRVLTLDEFLANAEKI